MPIPERPGWQKKIIPPRLPSTLDPLREWLREVTAAINEHYSMTCEDVKVSTVDVANTTVETEIYNKVLVVNSLRPKRVFRVNLLGRYSAANNSDTVTIRIKVGGTVVGTIITPAAVVSDAPISVHCNMTVRSIGSGGVIVAYTQADLDNGGADNANTTETLIDTTTHNTIQATATWSAANVGNTVSIDQGFTEVIY